MRDKLNRLRVAGCHSKQRSLGIAGQQHELCHRPCVAQRLLSVTEEAAVLRLSAQIQNTPSEPGYATLSKSNAFTHSHFKKGKQAAGNGTRCTINHKIKLLRHRAAVVQTMNWSKIPKQVPGHLNHPFVLFFFNFCVVTLSVSWLSVQVTPTATPATPTPHPNPSPLPPPRQNEKVCDGLFQKFQCGFQARIHISKI